MENYYDKEGHYPINISQLVPGYLSSIPVDYFNNGQALKLISTHDDYIIYSIGPDGIDNKSLIINRKHSMTSLFYITRQTKGDLGLHVSRDKYGIEVQTN